MTAAPVCRSTYSGSTVVNLNCFPLIAVFSASAYSYCTCYQKRCLQLMFVVGRELYTKLTLATPTSKTNASAVTHILIEHGAVNSEISSQLLTDKILPIAFKLLLVVYGTLTALNNTTKTGLPKKTARQNRSIPLLLHISVEMCLSTEETGNIYCFSYSKIITYIFTRP